MIKVFVNVHRAPHLLRCQGLEVRKVRHRPLRPVSAPACKQIQENLHGLIEKLPIPLITANIYKFFTTTGAGGAASRCCYNFFNM